MNWLWQAVPLGLAFAALYWLLPRPEGTRRLWGALCGVAALGTAGFVFLRPTGAPVDEALFYLFAGVAVVAAVCMITNPNPVYAALWFALVTLSTCGLFLLQSAPFLAAATVIVYAGAIIVTFLFVIMLARQAGSATYDRQAREPLAASLTACVLLGAILYTLGDWSHGPDGGPHAERMVESPAGDLIIRERRFLAVPRGEPHLLSRPDAGGLGTLSGLGRSLFTDYLFAVEMAGTLLLVASIGAILIAPRRSQGNS